MLELKAIINLSGSKSVYTKSREILAQNLQKRMYGKLFFYSIPDLYDDIGFCSIESITYDRLMDTFIYVIKDFNTNHVYITERCNICLIEIE